MTLIDIREELGSPELAADYMLELVRLCRRVAGEVDASDGAAVEEVCSSLAIAEIALMRLLTTLTPAAEQV